MDDIMEPSSSSRRPPGLLDLPREVIRNIALHIYDPMELSQQDRLTWGIFSTVDMHEERQDDLYSVIEFGSVCRKVRREVRVVLFRCIRTPTIRHVETVLSNRDGWARYVRSLIIDLSMFDSDEADVPPGDPTSSTPSLPPAKILRTCWSESTLISRLIQCLPSLNHVSFFADASDDTTLALLFGSLIPHPSTFAIPPPTVPASPSAMSTMSFTENAASLAVYNGGSFQPVPLTSRLRSFGWRQRAPPPNEYRSFAQTSTFVSTLHLLRHAHRLSFLVLDADLDEMYQEDVIAACQELSLREPPIGEEAEKVSLMLCGPIRGWGNEFLAEMVKTFGGIKELFLDRPLRKSKVTHETTFESFTTIVEPLSQLPYLRLLQVGSYTFSTPVQSSIVFHLAQAIPSLLVVGLLGEAGDTNWWGIWRRWSTVHHTPNAPNYTPTGLFVDKDGRDETFYDAEHDLMIMPLGDGHQRRLEETAKVHDAGRDWEHALRKRKRLESITDPSAAGLGVHLGQQK